MSRSGGGVDPRWDDLIAGWKLKEYSDGSGAVPREDVLGVYELTDTNTVASVTSGPEGEAASFDAASNEYLVSATTTDFLMLNGAPKTILVWVNPGAWPQAFNYILHYTAATAGHWFLSGSSGNSLTFRVYIAGALNSNATTAFTPDAGWHMIIGWYSAVDGKAHISVDTVDGTPGVARVLEAAGETRPLYLSYATATQDYLGYMSSLYIFNSAIGDSAAWQTDMYNAGAGRSHPS